MGERKVDIPVFRKTRDEIIKAKGGLTYDQFFENMLGDKKR